VDDIEDGSHLRRGIPVAHAIYGVPTTINTANYVYFMVRAWRHALVGASHGSYPRWFTHRALRQALERCHKLGSPAAMNVFVLELLNLHRGQGQVRRGGSLS